MRLAGWGLRWAIALLIAAGEAAGKAGSRSPRHRNELLNSGSPLVFWGAGGRENEKSFNPWKTWVNGTKSFPNGWTGKRVRGVGV